MLSQILGLHGMRTRDGGLLTKPAGRGPRVGPARSSFVVFEPPPGATSTAAVAINEKGQVAVGTEAAVFLWERGTYAELGRGYPVAVNNHGMILGTTAQGVTIFQKGQRPRALGFNLIPTGFNDAGDVAGYVGAGCVGCASHALSWHDGVLSTLDHASGRSGHLGARALGLNNRGEIVGTSEGNTFPGRTHALSWSDGRLSDLGCYGGEHAAARGINDRGQIILTSYSSGTGLTRAFLVDGDQAIALGSPTRAGGVHAEALNNHGDVIGDSNGAPFLWRKGEMTDIRPLIPPQVALTVIAATDINDWGAIVGYGYDLNGNSRGFLLEPGD